MSNTIDRRQRVSLARCVCLSALALATFACLFAIEQVAAGGNKGKGGEEDIIMYNGNIVMRGDKKGGNFVLANNHPSHEEVEFSPDFFKGAYGGAYGGGYGEMGGF